MATQNFSYLNITVNTKTGLSTAQQDEIIALYGTNPANILFDEANKKIWVKGSPYSGKDWTDSINTLNSGVSANTTSINQIKAFLTGTASTIGGTFASNKYSIALTGLPTSGADKVNKTVKDYVNKLVTKVTALETGTSYLREHVVNSITTYCDAAYDGLSLLTESTGDIILNGTNLLVGNSETGTGEPSKYHDSTISGAINTIVTDLDTLKTGETGLQGILHKIEDIKTELEWDETAPSALNTIIDNLRRLKTNSVEYKGVKGSSMGAFDSIEAKLMSLSTGIPTNESPISLQSAINEIAMAVNNNAQAHADLVNGFTSSYINGWSYFVSDGNRWYDDSVAPHFEYVFQPKLKYNNGVTYISSDFSPIFYVSYLQNLPSAYQIHNHVIDMARSYLSTGIPYQITDLSYVNPIWGPIGHEGYDDNANTYTTYNEGIVQSIVQYEGKLRVSTQFNKEITERINNAKSDSYSYVNTQISNANIITWTELT